jgi:hypothetical protein
VSRVCGIVCCVCVSGVSDCVKGVWDSVLCVSGVSDCVKGVWDSVLCVCVRSV